MLTFLSITFVILIVAMLLLPFFSITFELLWCLLVLNGLGILLLLIIERFKDKKREDHDDHTNY